jgi:hypothetical protein
MPVNKKYKDTLFRSIFNDKKRLLELYNAIEGTFYQDSQALTINTLEDVLYLGMKNDISFIIDDTLVLIEHQSTINENMPLRMSMYLHRIWEKITNAEPKAIYGKHPIKIPNPKLIVLYNGKEDYPAEKILKLSSLFKNSNIEEKIIDVEVKVLNINKGCNPELEGRCKILADYAYFIYKVREYEENHTLKESIELTIGYCIKNNILKEYLEKHKSEVMNMLTAEFNLDEYEKVIREEGIEEGIEKGREKGREEGIEKGIEKGQDYVLKLMEQGLSYEEIKEKIKDLKKQIINTPV